jgi:hypothetical protein
LTGGYAPRFQAVFLAQASSVKMALSRPSRQQVTQAVETVEKVPFQKLIIEKWDKNIEK